MKTKTIPLDLYKCSPLFVWDCTAEELVRYLKKEEQFTLANPEYLKGAAGTVLTLETDDGLLRVVWTIDKKLTAESIGRLAHEVTHLCIRILEDKGVPYDSYRNADESLAYMVDFFMRKLYERK